MSCVTVNNLLAGSQKSSPGSAFPQDKLGSLLSFPMGTSCNQSFPASSAEDESGTRDCASHFSH